MNFKVKIMVVDRRFAQQAQKFVHKRANGSKNLRTEAVENSLQEM